LQFTGFLAVRPLQVNRRLIRGKTGVTEPSDGAQPHPIGQAVQASFQPASSRLESRSRLFSMDIFRKSGIKGDIL
jgi:hypothetical protein